MNRPIELFIEDLGNRPDFLGVAVFGSAARGDGRPDSDHNKDLVPPMFVNRHKVRDYGGLASVGVRIPIYHTHLSTVAIQH